MIQTVTLMGLTHSYTAFYAVTSSAETAHADYDLAGFMVKSASSNRRRNCE